MAVINDQQLTSRLTLLAGEDCPSSEVSKGLVVEVLLSSDPESSALLPAVCKNVIKAQKA